jgi:hypothetical protein
MLYVINNNVFRVEQHETQPNLASTSSKVHIYPNIIRHNYEEKLLMPNEESVSSNQQESSRIGNDGVFRRLVKTHNGGVMLIHPVSTSNVIIFPQNTSAAYQTVNFGNHFQTTAHSNFQQEYCLIEDDGTECGKFPIP